MIVGSIVFYEAVRDSSEEQPRCWYCELRAWRIMFGVVFAVASVARCLVNCISQLRHGRSRKPEAAMIACIHQHCCHHDLLIGGCCLVCLPKEDVACATGPRCAVCVFVSTPKNNSSAAHTNIKPACCSYPQWHYYLTPRQYLRVLGLSDATHSYVAARKYLRHLCLRVCLRVLRCFVWSAHKWCKDQEQEQAQR